MWRLTLTAYQVLKGITRNKFLQGTHLLHLGWETIVDKMPCLRAHTPSGIQTHDPLIRVESTNHYTIVLPRTLAYQDNHPLDNSSLDNSHFDISPPGKLPIGLLPPGQTPRQDNSSPRQLLTRTTLHLDNSPLGWLTKRTSGELS